MRLKPHYPQAHNNLGNALKDLGRVEEARAAYEAALACDQAYPDAHNNLGLLLSEQGQLGEAIVCYDQAIALNPNYADAFSNKANALEGQGRAETALQSYQQALLIDPKRAEFHSNMGNALRTLGRLDDAVASYQTALTLNPGFARAQCNLGDVLGDQAKPEEAVQAYRRAIEIDPDYADAYVHLAAALSAQGDVAGAEDLLNKALTLEPGNPGWRIRKALLLPVIAGSEDEIHCYREKLVTVVAELEAAGISVADPYSQSGTVNFRLSYHNTSNKDLMQAIARLHLASCPALGFIADHCRAPGRARTGRLRIGFISSYLRNHTIGKLNAGLIEHFDRDRFEVIVLRPPGKRDAMADRIDATADSVLKLAGNLDHDRQMIAEQELDILFYLDIGMDPYTYFLAFSRLAPVQAVTWGHPDTTGLPNMDYFLSSELMEPDAADSHYSEKLLRLRHLPTCYKRPAPLKAPVERSDYGLPETGRLYLCPQTLFKVHPGFDSLLRGLLERDSEGYVVFIADGVPGYWRKRLSERFSKTLGDVSERVIFTPRVSEEKYFGLLTLADAMIDIPTFSGGNSTLEAFAMGTPVVTWPDTFMRGQVTAGYYRQMGLHDLIASDREAYISLALRLAQDAAFKQDMQRQIAENLHKLFDRTDVVREIEDVFVSAFQTACKEGPRF